MSEHPTDAHFLFTFVFKQALRRSQLGSPKSSKIRSETDPCIIKAQVARYQYYKDSASANRQLFENHIIS